MFLRGNRTTTYVRQTKYYGARIITRIINEYNLSHGGKQLIKFWGRCHFRLTLYECYVASGDDEKEKECYNNGDSNGFDKCTRNRKLLNIVFLKRHRTE